MCHNKHFSLHNQSFSSSRCVRPLRELRLSTDLDRQKPPMLLGREGRQPYWIFTSLLPLQHLTYRCEFTRSSTSTLATVSQSCKVEHLTSDPSPPLCRDANMNVSPVVKMRPKSPNSCLDADARRRLTVANDNRMSINPPPEVNQPAPVCLRQRSSARCECACIIH